MYLNGRKNEPKKLHGHSKRSILQTKPEIEVQIDGNYKNIEIKATHCGVKKVKEENIQDETVSCGEETVSIGQETVSIGQETVSIGQETVSVGQETVSIGQETISCGEETVSCGEETVSCGEETTECETTSISDSNYYKHEFIEHINDCEGLTSEDDLNKIKYCKSENLKHSKHTLSKKDSSIGQYFCTYTLKNIETSKSTEFVQPPCIMCNALYETKCIVPKNSSNNFQTNEYYMNPQQQYTYNPQAINIGYQEMNNCYPDTNSYYQGIINCPQEMNNYSQNMNNFVPEINNFSQNIDHNQTVPIIIHCPEMQQPQNNQGDIQYTPELLPKCTCAVCENLRKTKDESKDLYLMDSCEGVIEKITKIESPPEKEKKPNSCEDFCKTLECYCPAHDFLTFNQFREFFQLLKVFCCGEYFKFIILVLFTLIYFYFVFLFVMTMIKCLHIRFGDFQVIHEAATQCALSVKTASQNVWDCLRPTWSDFWSQC